MPCVPWRAAGGISAGRGAGDDQAVVAADRLAGTLSTRELEVLRMLVQGYGIEEIGERLGLSPKTAANHQSSIKQKLAPTALAVDSHRAAVRFDHGQMIDRCVVLGRPTRVRDASSAPRGTLRVSGAHCRQSRRRLRGRDTCAEGRAHAVCGDDDGKQKGADREPVRLAAIASPMPEARRSVGKSSGR